MKVSVQALGPLWYGLISLGGGGVWQAWGRGKMRKYTLTSVLPLLLQLLLGLLSLALLLWAMPLPGGIVFSSMLQFNQVLIDLLLLLLLFWLFSSCSFYFVNNLSCTVAQRKKQKLKINNNLQVAIGRQRVPWVNESAVNEVGPRVEAESRRFQGESAYAGARWQSPEPEPEQEGELCCR